MSSPSERIHVPDIVGVLAPVLDHIWHLSEECAASQADAEHELERVLAEVQMLDMLIQRQQQDRRSPPRQGQDQVPPPPPSTAQLQAHVDAKADFILARLGATASALERTQAKLALLQQHQQQQQQSPLQSRP